MFKENKYKRWYFAIVKKYKNISIDGIYENHHIIPKSMEGTDDIENIVSLPPRVHFICHWLLTKMTEGIHKSNMTFALHTFFHFNKYRRLNFNSRQYEYHQKQFREACKNRIPLTKKDTFLFKNIKTEEEFFGTRDEFKKHANISSQDVNWLVKYCIDSDNPKKIIKGWGIWIDSIKDYSYNKYRPPISPNLNKKIICEHCHKSITIGNYKRWHGNKCKLVDLEGHYERTRQIAGINYNR